MKNIWLFVLFIALISCKKEVPLDYAIITGKITNIAQAQLTFNSADRSLKKVIKLDLEGNFLDTLKVDANAYILYDGTNKTTLYVDKGDNIIINYDVADYENTLVISGKGAEISNYLIEKDSISSNLMGSGTTVYELDENDYKAKFKEIKTTLESLLGNKKNISDSFKAKELRNINYGYLNKIDIYKRYHAHYTKQPDFEVSKGFLTDLENLKFDNEEDFLYSTSYKDLVNSYFNKEAEILVKKDSIDGDIAFLSLVSKVENSTIKNLLLYDNAKYGITYTENLEPFYTTFMNASTNEIHKKEITESYNKLKTVSRGEVSPKFENYENFAGGTTSLEDLKGKYVYIDVWATWCGPCKAEIPSLKELEKKYKNKNIHFVSISVDKASDYQKWKDMVASEELKGIQLFSDKSWESSFVEDYLIKGIPRFILVDPNGNIVNSNAPRPSDKKLIALFNEQKI